MQAFVVPTAQRHEAAAPIRLHDRGAHTPIQMERQGKRRQELRPTTAIHVAAQETPAIMEALAAVALDRLRRRKLVRHRLLQVLAPAIMEMPEQARQVRQARREQRQQVHLLVSPPIHQAALPIAPIHQALPTHHPPVPAPAPALAAPAPEVMVAHAAAVEAVVAVEVVVAVAHLVVVADNKKHRLK